MIAIGRFVAFCLVVSTTITVQVHGQSISRSELRTSFHVSYGVVAEVTEKRVQTQAGQGAVLGGIAGAVTSGHHHRAQHAAIGAAAGAILTAVLEGKHKAHMYTVDLMTGGTTEIIVEQGDIRVGDCVAVEQGRTANLRRVSTDHCADYGHPGFDHPAVYAKEQADAAECHTAKERVLDAETEEALQLAMKKVSVFCE